MKRQNIFAHYVGLKNLWRQKMLINASDRDTRDSLKRTIDRLEPLATIKGAPPSVVQEYREARMAMETLINKLREEGVRI